MKKLHFRPAFLRRIRRRPRTPLVAAGLAKVNALQAYWRRVGQYASPRPRNSYR